MGSYGKTTRLLITALVVVLGAFYLAGDYLGANATPDSRHLVRLAQLMVMMLVGAAVLLGIFKLIAVLWDHIVERQARDDDSSPKE